MPSSCTSSSNTRAKNEVEARDAAAGDPVFLAVDHKATCRAGPPRVVISLAALPAPGAVMQNRRLVAGQHQFAARVIWDFAADF